MRYRVRIALACVICFAAYAHRKSAGNSDQARQFLQPIPKDQRIDQALNRLAFGARPGDAAQVKAIGLKVWIARQLHPESIPENPVLLQKLKTLDTLDMTGDQL